MNPLTGHIDGHLNQDKKAEATQWSEMSSPELWKNDPVGLPDNEDIANLNRIIKQYEVTHPGEIKLFVDQATKTKETAFNDFTSSTDANSAHRHVMTLPHDLFKAIEKVYPLMFSNQKHMRWFMKTYPMFNTYKKY